MVLDKQRHRIDWWLVPMAKAMRNVNPNVFTWLSLLAAVVAALAFWQSGPERPGLLAVGAVMVLLNGVLDVLDGKVAKMTGKASPKGDYPDHAIDRFSDVLFIGGIAFSAWSRVEVGVVALVFTLLTSYLGTQAQAIGMGRNYGGLLGRADRMMLLVVVPWVEFGLAQGGVALPQWWLDYSPSLLDTMLLYFGIVGLLTTVQRFVMGLRGFTADGQVR